MMAREVEQERVAVVAYIKRMAGWLRHPDDACTADALLEAARDIERGEHRK